MTSKKRDLASGPSVDPADARAARAAALDSLARRDRSAQDLLRRLTDKGYDPSVAGAVVDRLCNEKLVDDRRYADNYVVYHANRGHGPIRVMSNLRQHGIEGALVEEAVAAYSDWIGQLRKVQNKKFGDKPPVLYADRQRQARFLAYRGFTGAQIRLALGFDTELDVDA